MSIANYLTALDEQRDALARNLAAMGVQASETEKLNTLVPKVLQIPWESRIRLRSRKQLKFCRKRLPVLMMKFRK